MANKFPLILNTSANQIQEIASGDNLDLTGCKIVGLDGINSGGIVTFTKSHVGAATTWGEDLVVTGNARVTGILTVGTNSVTISGNDVNITGVTTAANFKTGTSNLHNVGLEIAGINVLGADTPIGTGATIYDAGGAVFTGVVTATNYVGTINTPAQPNITSVGTLSALNVSGNVSIGGTLTYEDVTNIDAVGLITARNGINVSGGTATFAAAIDANSDLDVDGHTNLDNVSIAGVSTIADNSKLAFGTGEDLSLYHLTADNDGYIKYQNENGHLKIGAGAGANGGIQLWNRTYNKSYITCDSDDAVKIYFNNSKKIETTNTGAVITGICTATTFKGAVDATTGAFSGDATFNGGSAAITISANSSIRLNNGSWTGDYTKITHHDNKLFLQGGTDGIRFRNIGGSRQLKMDNDGHFGPDNGQTYNLGSTSLPWAELFAGSATFSDNGSASPIVDIRSDDGSPWHLQLANDSYSTGAYGLNFHLDGSGNGIIRLMTGASSAYKTMYLGLNNGSSTVECLTLTSSSTTSLNRIYAPSMTLSDNGSSSPLLDVRSDDGSPWQFQVANDSYSTSNYGLNFHLGNSGIGYMRNISKDTNFSQTQFGCQNSSGTHHHVFNYDNVGMRLNPTYDFLFDGQSNSWTGNNRCKLQYHANTLYICGGNSGGIRLRTYDGAKDGLIMDGSGNVTTSGTFTANGGGADAIKINVHGDLHFDGSGDWTGNDRTKIQYHSNTLYICGGTSGIRFRNRSGSDEVFLNDSCQWQNFKVSTDIRWPNGTSTWTGEYPGKIQHHGNCLYIQGGSGTQGHIFRSGVHNSDSWYIHSSNSNDRAIEPATNNAYSIGTSNKRVKRVYATTGDFEVPLGGSTSLTVNIGSAISSGTWTTAIGTGVLNHNYMYAIKIFWHYNGNGGTPFYALAGTFLCPASSNHANGTGREENLVTSCHVGGNYYLAVRSKMHNSTNSGLEVANYGWTAQAGSYYSVTYKRVM